MLERGEWADVMTDRRQFDLRIPLAGGSGPGDPGYITLKRGSYRYISWWSNWPLNPLALWAVLLQAQGWPEVQLTEARFNWPLGGAEWLRLVNQPQAFGLLPPTGTYLLSVALHNQPMQLIVNQLPFCWSSQFIIPPGEKWTLGWGPRAMPSATPDLNFVTGYAPFSKLRIRLSAAPLSLVTSIIWQPSGVTEVFVDNIIHNPPASESADLILDCAGSLLTSTIDVNLEFSNSV